jgi:hypothetical protein
VPTGYVYVIGPLDVVPRKYRLYKIGYTDKLRKRRRYANLQYQQLTGLPDYQVLVGEIVVVDVVTRNYKTLYKRMVALEASLHKMFFSKQVESPTCSEWFRLSIRDLNFIRYKC